MDAGIDHEGEAKLILNQKAMQLFGLGAERCPTGNLNNLYGRVGI